MISNPYLSDARAYLDEPQVFVLGGPDFDKAIDAYRMRPILVKKYAYSIPDDEALDLVARYSANGLLDPLAGSGYWGWLLEQMGVRVKLSDRSPGGPDGDSTWHDSRYITIEKMDALDSVRTYRDYDTLMLSWVPYQSDIGERVLEEFDGSTVILIGEGRGGCCGTDGLFDLLARDWAGVEKRALPQWPGLHDWIWTFVRK